jgi:hypothetical protein
VVADLLNGRAITLFYEHQKTAVPTAALSIAIPRALQNMSCTLAVENIDHTHTKIKSPKTNRQPCDDLDGARAAELHLCANCAG